MVTARPNIQVERAAREAKQLAAFEHVVDFRHRANIDKRNEIRAWLTEMGIKPFSHWGENGDVVWDRAWRKFYFKHVGHSVQFSLKFL